MDVIDKLIELSKTGIGEMPIDQAEKSFRWMKRATKSYLRRHAGEGQAELPILRGMHVLVIGDGWISRYDNSAYLGGATLYKKED